MHQLLTAVSVTLQHLVQADLATDARFNGSSPEGVLGPTPVGATIDSPRTVYAIGDTAVSVWLHAVTPDDGLRHASTGDSPDMSPPLALRLHYVVSPVVPEDRRGAAETVQSLLGRVIALFHAHPVLSGAQLHRELAGTAARLHVTPVRWDLERTMRFWEVARMPLGPIAAYDVRVDGLTDPGR